MTTNDREIYKRFGGILAYYRGRMKMTQKDVADAIGVAKSTYTYYEYGERRIPLEHIVELSNVLEFDIGEVMRELSVKQAHQEKWIDRYCAIEFSEDEITAIEDYIEYVLSKRR